MTTLSRRAFLACTAVAPWITSGAAAPNVLAPPVGVASPTAPRVTPPAPATGFVDHEGWILTTADRDAIAGREM
ncbi:MAG: hypothetical protein IT182_12675 [Acidobacteria bacterium]|nr:hypothetical protein [Acidobacteriota bacterium]